MTRLLDEAGLVDVYRRLHPSATAEAYTWWSNRGQAWANNVGWRIDYHLATPAVAATAIHLGVGQVTARVGRTALEVHVGVGEVDITGSRLDVGHVEVSAGVGSASLHGSGRHSSHRAFVAESAEGEGDGAFEMDVSVGVGDASVLLVDET